MYFSIATNIPQRLKTGFVVQGHIFKLSNKVYILGLSELTLKIIWNYI